jgi:hypothetical protein
VRLIEEATHTRWCMFFFFLSGGRLAYLIYLFKMKKIRTEFEIIEQLLHVRARYDVVGI